MTESQNNNELKIIKARVEQDKYAAVELKIIKANGTTVLKDLYIEKELENGSLFVASDNVLVTLHRTLKPGMVPNFELITKSGEIMLQPLYKEIRPIDNNMLIAIKAVPEMISVKNNQTLRTDATKVQEIMQDSKNIKDQMISTMKGINPTYQGDLSFLYEDAYEEASLCRLVKDGERNIIQVVAEKVSFIATDGIYMYTHSNIVPDLTKSEKIDNSVVENTISMNTGISNNNVYSPKMDDDVIKANEAVNQSPIINNESSVVSSNINSITNSNTIFNASTNNTVGSEFSTPVSAVSNLNVATTSKTASLPEIEDKSNILVESKKEDSPLESNEFENKSSFDSTLIHSANIDRVELTNDKEDTKKIDNQVNSIEDNDNNNNTVYSKNLFNEEMAQDDSLTEQTSTDDVSSLDSHIFDDFFGISDTDDSDSSSSSDSLYSSNDDRYEQLSDMISRVISKDKSEKARIRNYEEKIKDLETKISKVTAEVESKTKKVNILINQNRQLGDDNRALKNRVNGLENKTSRLEEENRKYLSENERLKAEAKSRENKLSAMISSVSELLGSYRDVDNSYAKRKVA